MDNEKEDMKKLMNKIESQADLEIVMEYEERSRNREVKFFSIEEVKKHLELKE